MELIKAAESDFERLTEFYRYVIDNTADIPKYTKWVYGKHPTDEMILMYIREGAMYYCEKGGAIISAVAATPNQSEDYFDIDRELQLADDEVSVVHILCVDPKLHRQGVARETMRLVVELSRGMGKKAVRLDALACNTPAHHLYESLGFEKMGQRRWYADNVGWADFYLYEYIL